MPHTTVLVSFAGCVLFAWACSSARAEDISLEQARTAVGNWARLTAKPLGARIGQTVRDARTYRDADGDALFHVVRFEEGGFAVAAADDGILPVIAFSDDDDLVADDRNPLWVMLNRDLPQRRTFARKMAVQRLAQGTRAPTGEFAAKWQSLVSTSGFSTLAASVSDVRVSPLLTTTWSQQTAYGGACYNYYVPLYCGIDRELSVRVCGHCGRAAHALSPVSDGEHLGQHVYDLGRWRVQQRDDDRRHVRLVEHGN